MKKRALFVGQAQSRESAGNPALSGVAGRKIAELMGISHVDFVERYARENLLDFYPGRRETGKGDKFDLDLARARARSIELRLVDGDLRGVTHVVMVGRQTSQAFGFDDVQWCEWYEWVIASHRRSTTLAVAVMPHTSGIVTWWNDPDNRRIASEFLQALEAECRTAAESSTQPF